MISKGGVRGPRFRTWDPRTADDRICSPSRIWAWPCWLSPCAWLVRWWSPGVCGVSGLWTPPCRSVDRRFSAWGRRSPGAVVWLLQSRVITGRVFFFRFLDLANSTEWSWYFSHFSILCTVGFLELHVHISNVCS